MIDLRRAGRLAAILVSMALAVAACGGGGATATPAGEATPTPAGDATPTPVEATPTPEGPAEETPAGAIPTFDLDALTGALPGVDSYRTSFSVSGVEQYTSVVVTKPVLSKAITILDGGTVSTRFVIIGQEAWTAEGADGPFQSVPAEFAGSMLLAFDPSLMLGAYANLNLGTGAADLGSEEKNGVQARHVRLDSTTLVGAAAQMPAGAAIDIWIAEAGYLIAWEMTGFPEDANMSIQVTGVNDPANKVDAPN
jgi:hypothetical protein